MNIFMASSLFFAFCAFLLGWMIFLRRQDEVGKTWFCFSVLISLWGVGYSFQIHNDASYPFALRMIRAGDAVALAIPVAWLRFVYAFLNLKIPRSLFRILYSITAVLLLTVPTPLFIQALKDKSHIGVRYYEVPGIFFHGFFALFLCVVTFGFYLILRAYLNSKIDGEKKKQIKYLLFATLLGFSGAGIAFLPVYDIDVPVSYGALLLSFYPFFVAFAIMRYRLLDLNQVIEFARRDKLAAIGTLVASINHEIRNPLYIIQGLAESHMANLRDRVYRNKDEMVEKSNEILSKTAEQANRAIDIMKSFTAFAKRETSYEIQLERVPLNEVLEGVLPLIRHELELDKTELRLEIPADFPHLRADRHHLEEIFFNLLVNACQAVKTSGQDKGRIEVGAAAGRGNVRVEIRDNGGGMPSKVLSRIFQPFYTTKEEGTGLGLYVTKQLVERNGGKISVKSKPGRGTTFVLEFPQMKPRSLFDDNIKSRPVSNHVAVAVGGEECP